MDIQAVKGLGYYVAQGKSSFDFSTSFIVYVFEVDTTSSSWLIYRRFSQLAVFASQLSFEEPFQNEFPSKHNFQPYALTQDQLRERFVQLRRWMHEMLERVNTGDPTTRRTPPLEKKCQLIREFMYWDKNEPPSTISPSEIPNWAKPETYLTTSVGRKDTNSKNRSKSQPINEVKRFQKKLLASDTVDTRSEYSNRMRSYIAETEGDINGLWSCINAYLQATHAWFNASTAVVEEYKRTLENMQKSFPDMPNSLKSDENGPPLADSSLSTLEHLKDFAITQRSSIEALETNFRKNCQTRILEPLEGLIRDQISNLKLRYWEEADTSNFSFSTEKRKVDGWYLQMQKDCARFRDEEFQSLLQNVDSFHRLQSVLMNELSKSYGSLQDLGSSPSGFIQKQADDSPSRIAESDYVCEGSPSSKLWVWGRLPEGPFTTSFLRPRRLNLLKGQAIREVSCGGQHILYLTETGNVYWFRWGDSDLTRPLLVQELTLQKALNRSHVTRIACGSHHSVALTNLGEVYTWGAGENGRLGHGDCKDRPTPRKVMKLLRYNIQDIACGGSHTMVLSSEDNVFSFGKGKNGRLGHGNTKMCDTPREIMNLQGKKIDFLVGGWNFSFALSKQTDTVYCWGKQGESQCGIGFQDNDQLVPVKNECLSSQSIVEISCGYTHSMALSEYREVWSWGLGEFGQLGTGNVYQPFPERVNLDNVVTGSDSVDHIYCGAFHSVVTTTGGFMLSWGLNTYGACGLGNIDNQDLPQKVYRFADKSSVRIALGDNFSIALENSNEEMVEEACNNFRSPGKYAGMNSPKQDQKEAAYHIFQELKLREACKVWRNRILPDWDCARGSAFAHKFWREGIPPTIRPQVWPLAIGNSLKISPGMYSIFLGRARMQREHFQSQRISSRESSDCGDSPTTSAIGKEYTIGLIHTDLPRTFPALRLFDEHGPYYDHLLEVLEVFTCYRPDLGYIQGMSYLAAMLCLHLPDNTFLSFQCLANLITHQHLFSFYMLEAELSDPYFLLYQQALMHCLPVMGNHLSRMQIRPRMYLMNWLQTLFLQVLPLRIAGRVWDCFLLDGTAFLFRTGLAIQKILSYDILRCHEVEEVLPLLQKSLRWHDLWHKKITESVLFQTIEDIHLPSEIYQAIDGLVQDVYFYEKDGVCKTGTNKSAGVSKLKSESRAIYAASNHVNGILGGI